MIPPRPLGGVEHTSGAASDVPLVVVPCTPAAFRAPVQARAGGTTPKRSPPADYGPISKPFQVSAKFPASAVIEPESPPSAEGPLPLPPRSGPSGPEVLGLPARNTGGLDRTTRSDAPVTPPVDRPSPRVTPPNLSVGRRCLPTTPNRTNERSDTVNRLVLLLGLVIAASSGGGCASLTNPVADGIPVADCRMRSSAGRETNSSRCR